MVKSLDFCGSDFFAVNNNDNDNDNNNKTFYSALHTPQDALQS